MTEDTKDGRRDWGCGLDCRRGCGGSEHLLDEVKHILHSIKFGQGDVRDCSFGIIGVVPHRLQTELLGEVGRRTDAAFKRLFVAGVLAKQGKELPDGGVSCNSDSLTELGIEIANHMHVIVVTGLTGTKDTEGSGADEEGRKFL